MKREPLLTAATIVAIVSAGIALLVAFGLPVTADQTQAILGFVTIVAPLVVAWIARSKVTPLADPKDNDGVELVRADAEEIL